MTMAMSVAVHEGAKAVVCASTGNTSASAGGLRRRRPASRPTVLVPEGKIAAGKMSPGRRCTAAHAASRSDGNFDDCLRHGARDGVEAYPVVRWSTPSTRHRIEGQKTGGLRDRRLPRRRPRHPRAARRQRRQHHGVLEGLQGVPPVRVRRDAAGRRHQDARHVGLPGRGCRAIGDRRRRSPTPRRIATAIRIGNPASWKLADGGPGRVRRPLRRASRTRRSSRPSR